MEYPKNKNDWLNFAGSNFIAPGSTVFAASNNELLKTSAGQFNFGVSTAGYTSSPYSSKAGQKFNAQGKNVSVVTREAPPNNPN